MAERQEKKPLWLTTLEKTLSRKLVVFVVGTVLFVMGDLGITKDDWIFLACLYVGVQGGIEMISVLRKPNV